MNFLKGLKGHSLPLLIFLILSAILILSWFRFGLVYGGGDVGLQTYNPQRFIENIRYTWEESSAPGVPLPYGLAGAPLQFLLFLLQIIGFSPVAIQASLFFVLLFLMGIGMYILCSYLLKERKEYAIAAGIFYMFNPYMLIQVWHRFIHNSMVFAAALPFLIWFWLLWLKKGRYIYLFIFLLINLIGSYLYAAIAFIVTAWLIFFLIALSNAIFPWTGIKGLFKNGKFFLLAFILWILTNAFWLIPTFKVGPSLFSEQHSGVEESVVTLINISKQAALPFSLQLINPFYLFNQADFGSVYNNFLFRLIPWLIFGVVLTGLVKGFGQKKVAGLGLIFLIIIFLSKGSSPPFGYLYLLGFSNFFPLGVMRNPFEKAGILLPFFYSIFFIFGLKESFSLCKHYINDIAAKFLVGVVCLSVLVYAWPMFAGEIFGKIGSPPFVKVPADYTLANSWIIKQQETESNKGGRILHLPLTLTEDIKYNWEFGYSGLEPSQLFFTALPSLSHNFNIERVDDSLTALSLVFHLPFVKKQEKVIKLLQDFNVRYIVLHKDVAFEGKDLEDPRSLEETLDKLSFFSKKEEFGKLKVYEISADIYQPKIMIPQQIKLVYPAKNSTLWPWFIEGGDTSMITPVSKDDEFILQKAGELIIFPKDTFSYTKVPTLLTQNILAQLLSATTIADSPLKGLFSMKQILGQNGEIQSEKSLNQIILATDKLVKIYGRKDNDIAGYSQIMNDIFNIDLKNSRLPLFLKSSDLITLFSLHQYILANIEAKNTGLENQVKGLREKLGEYLAKNNLGSKFLEGDVSLDRKQIFNFQVPKEGDFDLLMVGGNDRNFYPNNLEKLAFTLNGTQELLTGKVDGDFISFGKLHLPSGLSELSYMSTPSANLILKNEDLVKFGDIKTIDKNTVQITSSAASLSYFESKLPDVIGGETYKIAFEASVVQGSGFYLQVEQDGDAVDKTGNKSPQLSQFFPGNSSWQSYNLDLGPLRLMTKAAKLRVIAAPPSAATNNIPSSVLIRDLKIEKVLDNKILLRTQLNINNGIKEQQAVIINQKSPIFYEGKIKLTEPNFLIFNETYHSGWKLTLSQSNQSYTPDKHYLANLYGNAWYIDKTGEFDFRIEFDPQNYVTLGIYMALFGWATIILFCVYERWRRNENN